MAENKTINFLPEIFRTTANKKFLNATLDQLIQEPKFKKINGYIGRTFAPTAKQSDPYIEETDLNRQHYQLEPGVITKDDSGNIDFFSSYIDLLDKIKYYGGLTNNHSRLFANEYYNFSGAVDFDKLVNFNQYYWLPEGPNVVTISSNAVPFQATFVVSREEDIRSYKFDLTGNALNPKVSLRRGGTYTFIVNQGSAGFWIQTEKGTSGRKLQSPNLSTREVYGVENNGTASGTIVFAVPQATQQDFYIKMPTVAAVDYATELSYQDIANQLLSTFSGRFPGLDGESQLENKSIIFANYDTDPNAWTSGGAFEDIPMDEYGYDYSNDAWSIEEKTGVWNITLEPADENNSDYFIRLAPKYNIPIDHKVFIKNGIKYANVEFFKNNQGRLEQVPSITANLTKLYYQDASNPNLFGEIELLDPFNDILDVEDRIIGQKTYTSPTGVKFTNGLKIKFDLNVQPAMYAGQTFYVEGVGRAITLVNINSLVTPEVNLTTFSVPYDTTLYDNGLFDESSDNPTDPDYILINRACKDLNPWSRQNRWFHEDVIRQTAVYNKTLPVLDQNKRAARPIIEFNSNLQLFNFAKIGKRPVDLLVGIDDNDQTPLNDRITDAFTQIENSTTLYRFGVGLGNGTRIVFTKDKDPAVRNKIYKISLITQENSTRIHLVPAEDGAVLSGQGVLVLQGASRGNSYWFDGSEWHKSQQKVQSNQAPLFDIVNENGVSVSSMPGSTFAGNKIFSYQIGTSSNDSILGFPVKYRAESYGTLGDIEFSNNFEIDTFVSEGTTFYTKNFFIKENTDTDFILQNTWTTVNSLSKQYQIINYTFDGTTNYFDIDITAVPVTTTTNLRIYLNNQLLSSDKYELTKLSDRSVIKINSTWLTVGDRIDIKVYSNSVSELGYYEIPLNLDYNALNQGFSSLTLGQVRNHLNTIAANNVELVGNQPGRNNLRDLDIRAFPGTILQHSAPVIYSNLFLLDQNLNFVKALGHAQKEYTRFKNKFLELATNLPNIDPADPINGVDQIIQAINQVKNNSFPWYYSDMIPVSLVKNTIEYQVYDANNKEFEITNIFNDTIPSSRAVLVYHTNVAYTFQGTALPGNENKTLLTNINPNVFKNVRPGHYVTGPAVNPGTYVVAINNTGYQDTSTITLSSPLLTNGIISLKTQVIKKQLIKGREFQFDQQYPIIRILTPLNYGEYITIVEYENTDGCFVPETPSKLGLYPKFEPAILPDDTYREPILVVQGHDGSLTPAFGDYRDEFLLELEKRIYNNIKGDDDWLIPALYQHLPGKFRNAEYSNSEFNKVLSKSMLQWAGGNRLEYSKNTSFQANDPFTWNYKKFQDLVNGEYLPGHWRAIFKYFYDTDRPHTHPWEMFGFSREPHWWKERYGPTPVTSENVALWNDVRQGYIADGPRRGIAREFSRPFIERAIPVDSTGNLRPPADFLVKNFNSLNAAGSWAIGDCGPVESAWRRSSEYPFALQLAIALTSPAFYFGSLISTSKYQYNPKLKQYLWKDTNHRIAPRNQPGTQGVIVNGATYKTVGYLNWVADWLTSNGFSAEEKILSYFSSLNVQLVYKAAGYTDKKYLTVLAEQSSPTSINESVIVPNENYTVHLAKSAPTEKISYSAVVIEKTNTGYSVQGYDLNNPYFTIIPSLADNQYYTVTAMGQSGVVYENYQNIKMSIPYGFEFSTKQQVVDFLISYQRYLISQGFVFDVFNTELEHTQDWELSVKEFLTWSTQGWRKGAVLVLSPALNALKIVTSRGTIDHIYTDTTGSRIVDLNFKVVGPASFVSCRIDNEFTIELSSGVTIGYAEFQVVEYEHALVFDNQTVFNDIIYKAELGNRQFRLKIVGSKTADWNGTLSPSGFVYNSPIVAEWRPGQDYRKNDLVVHKQLYYVALENISAADTFNFSQWLLTDKDKIKTGLLPNFSYNAGKLAMLNDIDNLPPDSEFDQYSIGITGFRPRQYLDDLGISKTTQAKFYQGFIKEKGTLASARALSNGQFADLQSNVEIYEEWALRVGEYGALEANKQLEIILDEEKINSNPTTLRLFYTPAVGEVTVPTIVNIGENDLYQSVGVIEAPFAVRDKNANKDNDLLTAGYVHVNDIDASIFDMAAYDSLSQIVTSIGTGFKIWVAKDFDNDWNVYRVSETDAIATTATYVLGQIIQITTNKPHQLVAGQVFALRSFGNNLDGFYRVLSIVDNNNFTINYLGNIEELQNTGSFDSTGTIFRLDSMRFEYASDLANYTPPKGWRENDKIWVDNSDINSWAVYNKSFPWKFNSNLILENENKYQSNSGFGSVVKIFKDQTWVAAAAPNATSLTGETPGYTGGHIVLFKKQDGHYTKHGKIIPPQNSTKLFGHSLDSTNNVLFVGAPGDETQTGYVTTYNFTETGWTLSEIILPSDPTPNQKFGFSLSVSADGQWLYVGAPGIGKVYAYVKTSTGYVLAGNEITPTTLQATDTTVVEFGYSVKTTSDGAQLVIGDPGYTVIDGSETYLGAGRFYIVDRTVEAFKASGTQYAFTTLRDTTPTGIAVRVDGILQTLNSQYIRTGTREVTFITPPASYSTVTIDTNEFNLVFDSLHESKNSYARLGHSLEICPYNCTVFVSAPYFNTQDYHNGQVYRYLNAGRVYGLARGTATNPTVTVGDSIRINDFEIVFTGTTLLSVKDQINAANIGVTASIKNNRLVLDGSDIKLNANKLRILPGKGTSVLSTLGIEVFSMVQTIRHPNADEGEQFGTAIRVDQKDVTKLLISSQGAPTYLDNSFDYYSEPWESFTYVDSDGVTKTPEYVNDPNSAPSGNQTTFDGGSTVFIHPVRGTGTVYVMQLITNPVSSIEKVDQYVHIQPLETTLRYGDNFGSGIDVDSEMIVVGAPGDDSIVTNGGHVYLFKNPTGEQSWQKVRSQADKVDITTIDKLFVYDSKTKQIINRLDFIDPVKGKILGQAQENIDFATEFDPARYNRGNNENTSINEDYHWTEDNVGKIWWNLSRVRYLDYEQGDINYRVATWGTAFPGSVIEVLEWVESDVLPSQFTVTASSGYPKYADNSAYVQIQKIDPGTGNIKNKYYFWVVGKMSIATEANKTLSSHVIAQYIAEPQTQGIPYAAITQNNAITLYNINQTLVDKDHVLHIEYAKNDNSILIHSEYALVQENSKNTVIPQKIINKIVDSLVGSVEIQLGNSTVTRLVPDESLKPGERLGLSLRPRQTVFNDRKAAFDNFLSFANRNLLQYPVLVNTNTDLLYSEDPLPGIITDITSDLYHDQRVNSLDELSYIDITTLAVGHKVLVITDSSNRNRWSIYRYNEQQQFVRVKIQKYKTSDFWTATDWYDSAYDPTSLETHTVSTLKDINTLSLAAGDTIKVKNNGRGQFEIYQVTNNQTIVVVGIQNGTIQINGSKLYSQTPGNPETNNAQEIRNIFSALQNNIFTGDRALVFNQLFFSIVNYILSEQVFVDWIFKTSFISVFHQLKKLEQFPNFIKDNQTYYKDYIEEVKPYRTKIREYAIDYTKLDTVNSYTTDFDLPAYWSDSFNTFRSPNGEQPSDRLLLDLPQYRAWRDHHALLVSSITVSRGGSGYSSPPLVEIKGGGGTGAKAQAFINANTGAVESIVVLDQGSGYISTPIIEIKGDGAVKAEAYASMTNHKVRAFDTKIKFDRISYDTAVKEWTANTEYQVGTLVSYQGKGYRALVTADSGTAFNLLNFQLVPAEEFQNANDRTFAYYNPTVGMLPKVLTQIFTGLEYPGVKVNGLTFELGAGKDQGFDSVGFENSSFDAGALLLVGGELEISSVFDTKIESFFDDGNPIPLGTRPEDINIDGSKFVDKYSSHAPEELIPGLMFDHLNIQVFTKTGSLPTDPVLGYRIVKDLLNRRSYYRISGATSTKLARDLLITDTEIHVTNGYALPPASPTAATPGVIYINGEKITYYQLDKENGILGQIRRSVDGTGAAAVHAAGSLVVDSCELQEIRNANNKIWLTAGTQTPANGQGLVASSAAEALFLKSSPWFTPS